MGDSASELNSTESEFASSSSGVTRMDKPNISRALLSKRELNHRTFPRFVSLPNSCSNAFMFQSKYTYLAGFCLASRVQVGVEAWSPKGRAIQTTRPWFCCVNKASKRDSPSLLSIMQECSIASLRRYYIRYCTMHIGTVGTISTSS